MGKPILGAAFVVIHLRETLLLQFLSGPGGGIAIETRTVNHYLTFFAPGDLFHPRGKVIFIHGYVNRGAYMLLVKAILGENVDQHKVPMFGFIHGFKITVANGLHNATPGLSLKVGCLPRCLPRREMLTGSRDGEEYRPEKLPHITVCSVGYPERLIGTLAARAYCRRRNPARRLRSNTTPGEWTRPVPGTRWCLTPRPQLAKLCLDQ